MKGGYVCIVANFIRHSRLAIIFLLIVSGCAGIIYKNLPSTFVPSEDQGYMFAAVEMPDGTSANRTQAVVDKLNAAMMENIKGRKGSGRISCHPANLLDESTVIPGGFDVVWMSQFLDCFPEDMVVSILKRVAATLKPGARVFIMENLWDRQTFFTA